MSAKKKSDPVKVKVEPAKVTNTPVKDFFDSLGNKAPLIALGLMAFIGFMIFKDFLLFHKAYFFKDIGSDSYNSNYPFLVEETKYIAKHGIPKWSFNFGMGQSLFPFVLRDPSDIFLYMAGKDHIVFGMIYNELAKIICGGMVFYYYLKTLNTSNYSALIGAVLFAFCGFNILGSSWYLFSFESFNIALILLAFELLFQKQKWYLFPFTIMLIGISQPFNFAIYSIFLTIYALFRHYQAGRYTGKEIGRTFIQMIGLGAIGILLSGPFLVENIFQLLESPRGSGSNSYASIFSSAPMFAVADVQQLGTSVMRFFSSDILGTGTTFKGWTNFLEAPIFYCGLPCLLLMPQVFQFLEKRMRIAFFIFLGVWILPVIFPYFRRAFWLFTGDYYRIYSLFVGLVFIYYSLIALDLIIKLRKINLIVLIVSVVVLFGLLHYPFFDDDDIVNTGISVFVTVMLVIYALLLFFIGKPGSSVYLRYVFFVALIFELIYLSDITVNKREAISAKFLSERKGYNDSTVNALNYLKQNDNSFYRIDKSYASSPAMHFSLNDALAQDYKGTSGYNSFNQQYYISYLQLMGISNKAVEIESRWAMGLTKRIILETENRVKYMFAKTEINPLWYILCDSLTTFSNVKVFRNKYVLPVGYTYDHYLRESAFENINPIQKDFITLKTCIIRDDDVTKVAGLKEFQLKDTIQTSGFSLPFYQQSLSDLSKDTLVIKNFDETSLTGTITATDDKIMYLTIPYDGGWKLKVDDQPTDKIIIDGGMTGVMLKKGTHTIEMLYGLRYLKPGIYLCIVGLLAFAGVWLYTKKKKPVVQL